MFNSPFSGACWSSIESHVAKNGGTKGLGGQLRQLLDDDQRCSKCWVEAQLGEGSNDVAILDFSRQLVTG